MKVCEACFSAETWIPNATQPSSGAGNCDFGHGLKLEVWETSAWTSHLLLLFDLYELAEDENQSTASSIEQAVQEDWSIFALEVEVARTFLESAVPGHEFFGPEALVKLKQPPNFTDHSGTWNRFSAEIRFTNRFFLREVLDRTFLEQVFRTISEEIGPEEILYRARFLSDNEDPLTADMGAPVPSLARSGRANPVGIPYLYLAHDLDTCIYEARVTNHSLVTVGRFIPQRVLNVVNLADFRHPDFFADDQLSSVNAYRLLSRLSYELSKPVKEADGPLEYIPTQYLCESVKNYGYDGVIYTSSLNKGGKNLVLFDVNSAVCTREIIQYSITSLTAEWQEVFLSP